MGLLLITRFTMQEVLRRWLFLALLLISLLLVGVFALLFNITVDQVLANHNPDTTPQMAVLTNAIVISVLATWAAYLMSSTLTIFVTAGMISGEVEAGTFAVMVPKPLRRAEIIFGKWLAYALILSVYTALLVLAFLVVIYLKTGYWPEQVLEPLGMLELSMLTVLALTTLGGTLMSTVVNGAVAFMLFIGAPLASITQFAIPTQSQTIKNIITIINMAIPADALWRATSSYLLPTDLLALFSPDAAQGLSNIPLIGPQSVSTAFLIWVVLYCIALPAAGALRFQRRDL
ncbi:MAG: ABC transporter permease subunit [Chloroflexota bacterium]|nr:ABC transporter permease subunit [Chloroflexota bacterium]